jgi:diguanylate cyclase (GGDEF)-like protein/putative nucleotidyltransferase with HDIG domain
MSDLDLEGQIAALRARVEELHHQAITDGLTGLLNHRAFYERLGVESARAVRYAHPLALAVFDLDAFKDLNDACGHPAGDQALRVIARVLTEQARAGDVVARLGGDEFAVLTPETDAVAGLRLGERVRVAGARALAAAGLALTVSVGVADLSVTESVDDLVRVADAALYYAKRQGRNQSACYTAEAIQELSYDQALLHGKVRSAAQALNLAVDAKDGAAREHAEAVARLAGYIAARLGWDVERRARLREAALLHDVGKLGVPAAVLRKSGPLTRDDHEQVKQHSAIGARMVEGLLDSEQRSWVYSHHERPDGQGYPDGLHGESIPEGARILAVAEAYDAMTRAGHGARLRSPADAITELRRRAHRQFDADAVDAIAHWAREREHSGLRVAN